MKPLAYAILLLIVAAAAAAGGYWYGTHHGNAADSDPAKHDDDAPATKPVATVKTARATIGEISQTVTAYGSVVAKPEDVHVVSVPFESRVVRVLVTPGQPIAAGTELIEVEPSPDSQLALQDAKNAVEAATKDLDQVQQRFGDRLATNQELAQAQQALQSTQLKLKSLRDRGVDGGPKRLKSETSGVLQKVDAQEGQVIAAGGALAEVAAENRIEIRIGVEPEDARILKPDQPAKVRSVTSDSPRSFEAKVRLVSHKVNAESRLVDVFLSIPPDSPLLIDQYVRADLTTTQSKEALIVPRSAALPREEGFVVFTVFEGHAREHKVKVGLTNDDTVELVDSEIKAGDEVVFLGNHELEDGMEVEVESASTAPATTAEAAP
ncbi:MAG TPA: efflux RND transporter periplasmic adaptor subunit [Tepidisphaeraceae bacterium]